MYKHGSLCFHMYLADYDQDGYLDVILPQKKENRVGYLKNPGYSFKPISAKDTKNPSESITDSLGNNVTTVNLVDDANPNDSKSADLEYPDGDQNTLKT